MTFAALLCERGTFFSCCILTLLIRAKKDLMFKIPDLKHTGHFSYHSADDRSVMDLDREIASFLLEDTDHICLAAPLSQLFDQSRQFLLIHCDQKPS